MLTVDTIPAPFCLATVRRDAHALPILVSGGVWVDLRAAAGEDSPGCTDALDLASIMGRWETWRTWLTDLAGRAGLSEHRVSPDLSTLTIPIRPPHVYGAVANYYDHAAEMDDPAPDPSLQRPFHFVKPLTSLSGPYDPIVLPAEMTKCDWEAELAVVIGRPARDVRVEDALAYVAGYTVMLDVTARDGRRTDVPFEFDWIRMKGWPTFGPFGPWIVPAQFVPDPQDLAVRLWIDGDLLQDFNTSGMVFGIGEQIAWLSSMGGLMKGDVIATGTGAGVGMARGQFLEDGQTVAVEIAGIGRLENVVSRALA